MGMPCVGLLLGFAAVAGGCNGRMCFHCTEFFSFIYSGGGVGVINVYRLGLLGWAGTFDVGG